MYSCHFIHLKIYTTFNNGSLGSCIDEERSQMRYLVRIAWICESSSIWTQLAPIFWHVPVRAVYMWVYSIWLLCRGRKLTRLGLIGARKWRVLGNRVPSECQATAKHSWDSRLSSYTHNTPHLEQDYPLNLSISVSGGKETNKDSPSNGEWSGMSSNLKAGTFGVRIVISRSSFCVGPCTSSLE